MLSYNSTSVQLAVPTVDPFQFPKYFWDGIKSVLKLINLRPRGVGIALGKARDAKIVFNTVVLVPLTTTTPRWIAIQPWIFVKLLGFPTSSRPTTTTRRPPPLIEGCETAEYGQWTPESEALCPSTPPEPDTNGANTGHVTTDHCADPLPREPSAPLLTNTDPDHNHDDDRQRCHLTRQDHYPRLPAPKQHREQHHPQRRPPRHLATASTSTTHSATRHVISTSRAATAPARHHGRDFVLRRQDPGPATSPPRRRAREGKGDERGQGKGDQQGQTPVGGEPPRTPATSSGRPTHHQDARHVTTTPSTSPGRPPRHHDARHITRTPATTPRRHPTHTREERRRRRRVTPSRPPSETRPPRHAPTASRRTPPATTSTLAPHPPRARDAATTPPRAPHSPRAPHRYDPATSPWPRPHLTRGRGAAARLDDNWKLEATWQLDATWMLDVIWMLDATWMLDAIWMLDATWMLLGCYLDVGELDATWKLEALWKLEWMLSVEAGGSPEAGSYLEAGGQLEVGGYLGGSSRGF
ncbi:hypothetical protein FPV67DRAFT_1728635 [Lyophyllum atratum]|nr:hypothetical protein FPV67DRAFT_1728635 [Lyophyllum atratum]